MTTTDERQAAEAQITELLKVLRQAPAAEASAIIEECEALLRAVSAFHMEGIRFRIYNVDRILARQAASLPSEAARLLEQVRRHLEAAGFHTRSHQSPV